MSPPLRLWRELPSASRRQAAVMGGRSGLSRVGSQPHSRPPPPTSPRSVATRSGGAEAAPSVALTIGRFSPSIREKGMMLCVRRVSPISAMPCNKPQRQKKMSTLSLLWLSPAVSPAHPPPPLLSAPVRNASGRIALVCPTACRTASLFPQSTPTLDVFVCVRGVLVS